MKTSEAMRQDDDNGYGWQSYASKLSLATRCSASFWQLFLFFTATFRFSSNFPLEQHIDGVFFFKQLLILSVTSSPHLPKFHICKNNIWQLVYLAWFCCDWHTTQRKMQINRPTSWQPCSQKGQRLAWIHVILVPRVSVPHSWKPKADWQTSTAMIRSEIWLMFWQCILTTKPNRNIIVTHEVT